MNLLSNACNLMLTLFTKVLEYYEKKSYTDKRIQLSDDPASMLVNKFLARNTNESNNPKPPTTTAHSTVEQDSDS